MPLDSVGQNLPKEVGSSGDASEQKQEMDITLWIPPPAGGLGTEVEGR